MPILVEKDQNLPPAQHDILVAKVNLDIILDELNYNPRFSFKKEFVDKHFRGSMVYQGAMMVAGTRELTKQDFDKFRAAMFRIMDNYGDGTGDHQ